MHYSWKDYLSFTKGERIGIFILIGFIVLCYTIPIFFPAHKEVPAIDTTFQAKINANQINSGEHSYENNSYKQDTTAEATGTNVELFYFDPNTASFNEFKRLGLSDKISHTIINYREKGGKFFKAEDIKKIYGLSSEQAAVLIPYIQIKENYNNAQKPPYDKPEQKQFITKETPRIIDINTATEGDWKSLPGIGEVLSKRIVKFRNSIHGFSSVQDVKRTYGLSDSTYQNILPYLTITTDTAQ